MSENIKINLDSEDKTKAMAKLIADFIDKLSIKINNRFIIYLSGNLGAGKTTFSQYFIKSFGYTDKVKSPTYTLIENYEINNKNIYHLDLYRLSSPDELAFLGLEDIINQTNIIMLIEWPEKGIGFVPPADIEINLKLDNEQRTAELIFDHNNNSLNKLWQELQYF